MNGRRLAVLGILLILTINLSLSFVPAIGGIAIRGAAHAPDVAKAADLTGEAENIGDLFGFWDKITTTGKAVDDGSGIAKGGKSVGKGAGDITESASNIFSYEQRKLQHEFDKHKEAFGLEPIPKHLPARTRSMRTQGAAWPGSSPPSSPSG